MVGESESRVAEDISVVDLVVSRRVDDSPSSVACSWTGSFLRVSVAFGWLLCLIKPTSRSRSSFSFSVALLLNLYSIFNVFGSSNFTFFYVKF